MPDTTKEYLTKHLENVIAAERNSENVLSRFSSEGEQEDVKEMFSRLSAKARTQHQRLEGRLREPGGSPSTLKSAVAHVLAATPLIAQAGQTPQEKNTQHLIITYAAAAAEMAMYEALANVSRSAETSRPNSSPDSYRRKKRKITRSFGRCPGQAHSAVSARLASSQIRGTEAGEGSPSIPSAGLIWSLFFSLSWRFSFWTSLSVNEAPSGR